MKQTTGNVLRSTIRFLLAEDDALYLLHRRNLTRIPHATGVAERFERVAALPQAVADAYDYGYGLVRDKSGGFMFTYAPYGNAKTPGAGGALSLVPDKPPREVAFGFRNPLGWCVGPEGEVFFTDNQGDWVATNKLCHIVEGRYYGWPNSAQKQHTTKPMGKPVVWVPYGWARSINGVAYLAGGPGALWNVFCRHVGRDGRGTGAGLVSGLRLFQLPLPDLHGCELR